MASQFTVACPACGTGFTTPAGYSRHISTTRRPECRLAYHRGLERNSSVREFGSQVNPPVSPPHSPEPPHPHPPGPHDPNTPPHPPIHPSFDAQIRDYYGRFTFRDIFEAIGDLDTQSQGFSSDEDISTPPDPPDLMPIPSPTLFSHSNASQFPDNAQTTPPPPSRHFDSPPPPFDPDEADAESTPEHPDNDPDADVEAGYQAMCEYDWEPPPPQHDDSNDNANQPMPYSPSGDDDPDENENNGGFSFFDPFEGFDSDDDGQQEDPGSQEPLHDGDTLRVTPFVVPYPDERAGAPVPPPNDHQPLPDEETNPYSPFANQMEWEIARWAKLRGPGSTAFSDLLAIGGVSLSFIRWMT